MKLSEKFVKSQQSKVVGYVYLAVAAYIVLIALVRSQPLLIASILPLAISTLVTMYVLNCVMYGGCSWYAWLSVVIQVLMLSSTVVSVTGASLILGGNKKK